MSKSSKSWYSIRKHAAMASAAAAAISGAAAAVTSAEIFIYGDIGESWWDEGVAAKTFVPELAALDVDQLTVRIASYGGSVQEGIAIHNALKRHRASVTVVIDSIAASIASLIAMAGDRVEIAENALMMLHAPWGYASGNSAELRQYADLLDTWSTAMGSSYAAKTGRPVDEIMPWLTDGQDHWFTAEEAVAEKLADATTAAVPVTAMVSRFAWASPAATSRLVVSASARASLARTPISIPAAAAALTPEIHMSGQTTTTAAPNEKALEDARAEGARLEIKRRADIAAEFTPAIMSKAGGGKDEMAKLQKKLEEDPAATADQARKEILALLAKDVTPAAGGYVAKTEDEADKQRAGLRAALEIKAGLKGNDVANPFRGYSLTEMARMVLAHRGVTTEGLDRMKLVAVALTHHSSDFPKFLENVAEKSMLKGAEEAEETFQVWTVAGELGDFKPAKRVDLGSFPSLPKVAEGAEYQYGTIGERGESIVLGKYGKMISLTREAIINDDLNGFSRLARKMGRAAIRTVGDLVYGVLTSNPNMADGNPLFHANHGNLLTAAAINTTSIEEARTKMARQKAQGQTTGSLNIRLAYVLCPVSLQGVANTVRDSEFEVGATAKNNTVPNSVRGAFEVVADARLDDASTTNWYTAASPTLHDTVEVAYLDGNRTPTLETQNGWSVDGVDWKVRMEAGVKALDCMTLQKNPNT